MSTQSNQQPILTEEQCLEIIGRKLERLEISSRHCVDDRKKSLVDHIEFTSHFTRVTAIVCQLSIRTVLKPAFNRQLLSGWLECLRIVPAQRKHSIHLLVDGNGSNDFLNRTHRELLQRVTSFSTQIIVLNVWSHFLTSGSSYDTLTKVYGSFDPTMTLQEYDRCLTLPLFTQKQLLLCRHNQRLENPSVQSESIGKVMFGEKVVLFEFGAKMEFIEQPKTSNNRLASKLFSVREANLPIPVEASKKPAHHIRIKTERLDGAGSTQTNHQSRAKKRRQIESSSNNVYDLRPRRQKPKSVNIPTILGVQLKAQFGNRYPTSCDKKYL